MDDDFFYDDLENWEHDRLAEDFALEREDGFDDDEINYTDDDDTPPDDEDPLFDGDPFGDHDGMI